MLRKLTISYIIIYWLAITFNSKLIDKGSYAFYLIVGFCLMAFLLEKFRFGGNKLIESLHIMNISDPYGLKFKNNFKLAVLIIIVYIILSFLGYGTWFGIEGLGFSRSYIMRHSYFLLAIPIGVFLAEAFYTEWIQKKLTFNIAIFLFIVLVAARSINIIKICSRAMFIGIGSFLFMRKKNVFTFGLMVLSMYLTLRRQSAPKLASVGLLIVILLPDLISIFLNKSFSIKVYFGALIVVILVAYGFEQLYEFAFKDVNAIWRLQFWINDAKIFLKTYGLGVGFGTAYATDDLFNTIYNASALVSNASREAALYVVAQHNSLINMFYRMGLVGGIVFINMHLTLAQWFGSTIKRNKKVFANSEENKWIIWAGSNFVYHFIIILLNPGLESPQFFWGYLCYFGILVGLLCRSAKLYNIMQERSNNNYPIQDALKGENE